MNSEKKVDSYIKRLKNNKYLAPFIAAAFILVALIGFWQDVSKVYALTTTQYNSGKTKVLLPDNAGWLFLGYYRGNEKKYSLGPYFRIIKSNTSNKTPFPDTGDLIQVINKPRNLIIKNYSTNGLTQIMESPATQIGGNLLDGDYTGFKIPIGEVVEVRHIDIRHKLDKLDFAVWVRIGSANI